MNIYAHMHLRGMRQNFNSFLMIPFFEYFESQFHIHPNLYLFTTDSRNSVVYLQTLIKTWQANDKYINPSIV